MKIYTCAFKPFEANESFFARDSGLLCKTFQKMGHDSKVVMPNLETEGTTDPDMVVRGSLEELADHEWWSNLGIDGVVFIAWGFKAHTPVIRAAREAGIRTCAIIETTGNPFPYGDLIGTIQTFWRKGKFLETPAKRLVGTLVRALYYGIKGIPEKYYSTVQIGTAHHAIFDTPSGMKRCLKVARYFPWASWHCEPVLIGYPIPDSFAPCPREQRRANVVSVARWDALRHKRPHLLMHVIDHLLHVRPTITFEIFGKSIPIMDQWHAQLETEFRERVRLRGIQPSGVVSHAIGTSMVLYCPSASDGIPLVVVEGLCGGCSVAGLETADVAGLYWAVQEGDGTFARYDTVPSHAGAILAELDAWQNGRRDPMAISGKWKTRFSTTTFAENVIKLIARSVA